MEFTSGHTAAFSMIDTKAVSKKCHLWNVKNLQIWLSWLMIWWWWYRKRYVFYLIVSCRNSKGWDVDVATLSHTPAYM